MLGVLSIGMRQGGSFGGVTAQCGHRGSGHGVCKAFGSRTDGERSKMVDFCRTAFMRQISVLGCLKRELVACDRPPGLGPLLEAVLGLAGVLGVPDDHHLMSTTPGRPPTVGLPSSSDAKSTLWASEFGRETPYCCLRRPMVWVYRCWFARTHNDLHVSRR